MVVVLLRHDSGFGFRIVGGTEEGSQVPTRLILLLFENEILIVNCCKLNRMIDLKVKQDTRSYCCLVEIGMVE